MVVKMSKILTPDQKMLLRVGDMTLFKNTEEKYQKVFSKTLAN